MAVPQAAALLSIKLFVPPVRADRIPRPQLLARLDEILRPGMRLALISAPAGFGKSSLLAEWVACQKLPTAWVSMDAGDNEPGSFLSYLMAALKRAQPGIAPQSQALLDAQPPAPAASVLSVLVNELSEIHPEQPVILVLDDFQFITAPEVRESFGFLVEHLPPGVRLVVSTRTDPPLPLARLRARGQMLELRAADLRFTNEEAAEFLAHAARLSPGSLPLDAAELRSLSSALTTRTEGWAAGLQMAVLALQGLARQGSTPADSGAQPVSQSEIAEFVHTFSGSHRFVLDYLMEEVLERLPPATVHFLLQTSLLERFCAELCEAMVMEEKPGSAPRSASDYRDLLVQFEQANLFLIPLDNERRWFRYHHLFSDLLQARLRQAHPQAVPVLHARASAWFEKENWIAPAIQHALAAEMYERAAGLVEQHSIALLERGELHNLIRWVNLLPANLASQRPWLCICRAWVYTFSGEMHKVEKPVRLAEALLPNLADEDSRRELRGYIAAIRSQCAVILNQPAEGLQQATLAQEYLAPNNWAYSLADWSIGYISRGQGDLEKARQLFERGMRADRERGNPWGAAMNTTDLGLVLKQQGKLRESLAVFRSTLAFLEGHQARRNGYVGRLLTAMAISLYEENQLALARQLLEEAIDLNQHWFNPNHCLFAYANLARVLGAMSDFSGSFAALDAAEEALRGLPVVAILEQSIIAGRTRLQLAQGKLPAQEGPFEAQVQDILHEIAAPSLVPLETREQRQGLAARVLLAQGRLKEALKILDRMEETARGHGRGSTLVEVLPLKALALYQLQDLSSATESLADALRLAQMEGFLRPILDSAPLVPGALPALLMQLARSGSADPTFCETLLAELPASPPSVEKTKEKFQPKLPSLIESLTDREIEVLHLLASGLTNAQIGERLFITTGTVKAHTAGIFRKLDAANRTQAVARARELGLLP